jgi:Mce-associated membrane protein
MVKVMGAVIVVALVAALVVTQLQLSDLRSQNNDRTTVLAIARVDAADVATYSYAHLTHDFGQVEAAATPSFRRSFATSSAALTKVLRQYKATATAKVLTAGLVSLSSTQAVVILFVNQTVSNSAAKSGPSTDDSRIEVTLVHTGGRWLLNRLKLL